MLIGVLPEISVLDCHIVHFCNSVSSVHQHHNYLLHYLYFYFYLFLMLIFTAK